MNKYLVMLISLAASVNVHAVSPLLNLNTTYNTGYTGNTALVNGAFDDNFVVNGSTIPVVAFPIPSAWVTTAGAQWISPSEDQTFPPPPTEGDLPGQYIYETSFENDFVVPTDVTISGSYAADNTASISVNGVSEVTGLTSPNSQFSFLTPFSITVSVNPGSPIVVDFVLTNYNTDNSDPAISNDGKLNPSGLLVSNFKATATPEPSTYAMLFAGLGAVLLFRRTRRLAAL